MQPDRRPRNKGSRRTSFTGSGSIQVLRVESLCVNDAQTIMSLFEPFPVESRSDSDFQKSATDVAISFSASSMPKLVAILDSSLSEYRRRCGGGSAGELASLCESFVQELQSLNQSFGTNRRRLKTFAVFSGRVVRVFGVFGISGVFGIFVKRSDED